MDLTAEEALALAEALENGETFFDHDEWYRNGVC